MDKQTHLKFNLNNFVLGVSFPLDNLVAKNRYKQQFSSRRVCFIGLKLAHYSFIESGIFSDMVSYLILSSYNFSNNDLTRFPFVSSENLKNEDFLQIVQLASLIEKNLHIENRQVVNKKEIQRIVQQSENLSDMLKENFEDLSKDMIFWLDLLQEEKLPYFIYNFIEDFTIEISYENMIQISQVIENKIYQYSYNTNEATIAIRCREICEVYPLEKKDSSRMILASTLYGIGKLYIKRELFQKTTPLEEIEIESFKAVSYFTQTILSQIFGFDDIAKLCGTFSEKLDGSGSPYETVASDLSLKARVLAILVIYQALREKRAYRESYTHEEAIEILKKEAESGKLDKSIVEDFERVFGKEAV